MENLWSKLRNRDMNIFSFYTKLNGQNIRAFKSLSLEKTLRFFQSCRAGVVGLFQHFRTDSLTTELDSRLCSGITKS